MSRVANASQSKVGGRSVLAAAVLSAFVLALSVCGCALSPDGPTRPAAAPNPAASFVIVTTPAVKDLGLAASLESAFRQTFPQYDIEATVVASADPAGLAKTSGGEILIVGQSGSGGLVKQGYAMNSLPLMSDRVVLIGPRDDPASAKTAPNLSVALKRIANAAQTMSAPGGVPVRFVGVAGDSTAGGAWAAAGVRPSGSWYSQASDTAKQLKAAADTQAYAMVDQAAYRALGGTSGSVVVLRAGAVMPIQRYVVLPLTSAHDPAIANAFAQWAASGAGQGTIARWGVRGSSGSLFIPAQASADILPSNQ
jgi:ABC-type tungstate transport system permease subunit